MEVSVTIISQFGYRYYEFENKQDISKAREIWATPCNQDEFESKLELEGIEFYYDICLPD